MGAVCPAVEAALRLHAVTNDPAPALMAGRGERMDRALEAVKDVSLISAYQLEGLVVVVPANLAYGHRQNLLIWWRLAPTYRRIEAPISVVDPDSWPS